MVDGTFLKNFESRVRVGAVDMGGKNGRELEYF